jgi:hypothetical protein
MGTQSSLYIEKEKDSFIGVNCYYDGYPEHMVKEISSSSYEDLYSWIIVAGTKGGFRLFAPSTNETEYMLAPPHYVYNPEDNGDLGIDYIYVKHLDGSTSWRDWATKEWKVI